MSRPGEIDLYLLGEGRGRLEWRFVGDVVDAGGEDAFEVIVTHRSAFEISRNRTIVESAAAGYSCPFSGAASS